MLRELAARLEARASANTRKPPSIAERGVMQTNTQRASRLDYEVRWIYFEYASYYFKDKLIKEIYPELETGTAYYK